MAERISQFTAFVDRSGRRRGDMTGDSAREGELGEQLFHPGLVLAYVGIDLAVRALQVRVAHQRWSAVAGAGHIEHVQVEFLDYPVQMHIDKILARSRAPVPHDQRLHVRHLQRPFQQRIIVEIYLANRQIVGGAPVRIHPMHKFRSKGAHCAGRRRAQM